MTPDDPRHGTIAGRDAHQRAGQDPCDACRQGRTRYEKNRRLKELRGEPRIVPTIGLRRRVEALQWDGWTLDQIAVAGGWKYPQSIDQVIRRDTCTTKSADRIIRAYDQLARLTPTPGQGTNLARALARGKGYAPAAAWDNWDDPAEKPKGVRNAA